MDSWCSAADVMACAADVWSGGGCVLQSGDALDDDGGLGGAFGGHGGWRIALHEGKPYNVREARTHVRHLREPIRSHDISDAANGVEFASFTCLSQITQPIVPLADNKLDQIRADDQIQPFRIGFEDHMPGQIRDWNEELQTTHDMPQTTFVIDGSVLSINPDEPKMQMFIWNNIFLSFGFDVKDHYKEIGGDAAAHDSYSADLAAVQAYAHIDDPKLHTSHEPIIYGSFDSGKTVLSNDVYAQLLQNSSEILKIQPHLVRNGKECDEYVKLYYSYESKGIIGNDRRHYLMDLLRTFPPDVNFLEDAQPTEKAKDLGFPRNFPHKLVCLRQELVDTFVDAKMYEQRKTATSTENQLKENDQNKTEEEAKDVADQFNLLLQPKMRQNCLFEGRCRLMVQGKGGAIVHLLRGTCGRSCLVETSRFNTHTS
uniref:Clu domain-containing protein n=1 Tax=Meloidogyne hapla TaxID=6305 RepID=A0A1I8AX79_MELHA